MEGVLTVIAVIWLLVMVGESIEALIDGFKNGLTFNEFCKGFLSFLVKAPMVCFYLYLGMLWMAVSCSG